MKSKLNFVLHHGLGVYFWHLSVSLNQLSAEMAAPPTGVFGRFMNYGPFWFHNSDSDGDRSQGKGRRVCLGGKICSISCRSSCFAAINLEETVEFNKHDLWLLYQLRCWTRMQNQFLIIQGIPKPGILRYTNLWKWTIMNHSVSQTDSTVQHRAWPGMKSFLLRWTPQDCLNK